MKAKIKALLNQWPRGQRFYQALMIIVRKADADNIAIHSASLTYTSVLSFVPVIALGYFLFDMMGGVDKFQADMEYFIGQNLAPSFADQIMSFVMAVRTQISSKAIGVFGFIGFVVAGINLLSKVELSLNMIWGKKRVRPWVNKMTTFWTIISLGPIFLGASLILTGEALKYLRSDNGEIARALVFLWQLVPYVTSPILFTAIYFWLPAHKVRLKNAARAGIWTGVLFEAAKQIYAIYAVKAIKASIYGSLAVAPVFLLWLNFVWMIFLFGAQICFYLNDGLDKPVTTPS